MMKTRVPTRSRQRRSANVVCHRAGSREATEMLAIAAEDLEHVSGGLAALTSRTACCCCHHLA